VLNGCRIIELTADVAILETPGGCVAELLPVRSTGTGAGVGGRIVTGSAVSHARRPFHFGDGSTSSERAQLPIKGARLRRTGSGLSRVH